MPIVVDPSSIVCSEQSTFEGNIQVGAGSVIHPCVSIRGNVVIGSNNIIEEHTLIEAKDGETLIIGNDNVIEVGCTIRGSIGDGNVLEVRSTVLGQVLSGCTIGAQCRVEASLDSTVMWPQGARRVAGQKSKNSFDKEPRRELASKMFSLTPKRLVKM